MELTSFKECEHTDGTESGHRRHLHSHHTHDRKVSPPNAEFVRTTFKTADNEPITGRSLMETSASNCEWMDGWIDRGKMCQAGGWCCKEVGLTPGRTHAMPTCLACIMPSRPHTCHNAGTCTMGAYGYNARIAQPVNGRLIKNYA